jgi:LmeA-like phospholipid-binding
MTDPWARPADQPRPGPPPPPQHYGAPPPPPAEPPEGKLKKLFSDPLTIVLVVVIVVALVLAGVLAGELYARGRADTVVARVTSCVVQDEAKASFDPLPPFLIQHMSGHYTNINIETAGNQIREAKGMKVVLDIKDVRLEDTATSSGSVGSLVANITWSAQGIKQTIQDSIPLIGSFVAKPEVVDNGLSLEVTELTGLGFTLPREAVQPALDVFTAQLTKNYPMGIHADSVEVTDTGVVSQFSTQNAEIPKGGEDPCFSGL